MNIYLFIGVVFLAVYILEKTINNGVDKLNKNIDEINNNLKDLNENIKQVAISITLIEGRIKGKNVVEEDKRYPI